MPSPLLPEASALGVQLGEATVRSVQWTPRFLRPPWEDATSPAHEPRLPGATPRLAPSPRCEQDPGTSSAGQNTAEAMTCYSVTKPFFIKPLPNRMCPKDLQLMRSLSCKGMNASISSGGCEVCPGKTVAVL